MISQDSVTPMTTQSRPVIAVFDFDGTLTITDSFLPFLYWTHGKFRSWQLLLLSIPVSIAYLLKLISNHQIKEIFLTQFYKKWLITEFQQFAITYAREQLPKLLNPVAIERLRWHQQQGHQIAIVSANLEIYLQPWAKQMGVAHLLATRLVVQNGRITGKIQGKCCYGPEKLARLQTLLGPLSHYQLYVYGDSQSDKEILSVADYPFYRLFTSGKGLWIK